MQMNYYIPSHDKKVTLHLYVEGNQDAEVIIMFSHGMAEHKERYFKFINELCHHHFLCAIHDHRGHGNSVSSKEDYGFFNDRSGTEIVEDLHEIEMFLKSKYPGKKLYMFSHSMGTLVARNYLQQYDTAIDKLVLCGPPYHNKAATLGLWLTKLLYYSKGDHYRSAFIQHLAFGSFDKKCNAKIPNGWINSNIEEVKKYNENQKCGFVFTTDGFINLFTLMIHCYSKTRYQMQHNNLPILMIAGEDDPVIGNQKRFYQQAAFLKDLGYNHVDTKLYPTMRHEILNETNHKAVYKDILSFYLK